MKSSSTRIPAYELPDIYRQINQFLRSKSYWRQGRSANEAGRSSLRGQEFQFDLSAGRNKGCYMIIGGVTYRCDFEGEMALAKFQVAVSMYLSHKKFS